VRGRAQEDNTWGAPHPVWWSGRWLG